ncbi:hypothetical protein [Bacillus cereus]|uniref:hypothetical protein n=1 Tax=Bacillus cereus TaxID=1396 RepID=UPI003981753F
MPLNEQGLKDQIKKGSEERERKFETAAEAKRAELTDTDLIEKFKNATKDADLSTEDIKKLDTFLEKAPVLKKRFTHRCKNDRYL